MEGASFNQRRLAAWFIDGIFCLGLSVLFGALGWLAAAIYWLVRDGFFQGQSIGKRLMELKVVGHPDQRPCSFKDSVVRNLLWVVPVINVATGITALYALIHDREGRHWGDRLAQTRVINHGAYKQIIVQGDVTQQPG